MPPPEKAARSVYVRAVTQTSSSHATHHGFGRMTSWEAAAPTRQRPLWADGQAQSSFELIEQLDMIESKEDIPQKSLNLRPSLLNTPPVLWAQVGIPNKELEL